MTSPDQQISSELSRELSLFHLTMMGLGMMIGAGVFLGIGNAVNISGPGGVLLTFALNGLVALFTALSYAELSSAVPRAGGAYNFARLAFGRGPSFIAGWMEWFASSIAGSLYAVTFAIYTVRYLEGLGLMSWIPLEIYTAEKIVAFIIACIFLAINYRGASETGKIGVFFTFGQTLFLVLIGIIGVVVVISDPSRLQNFNPFLPYGWSKLLITMGFTYVAFEGFEVIAQAGDEAIAPRKNLPKAMLYSIVIVTFTYVIVAFATIVAVKKGMPGIDIAPWQWIGSFKERGFGEAIAKTMPYGNFFLTLAVIFASISALNATIFSATRAAYALGRDRLLPKFFSLVSKKRKTPVLALFFTGLIVICVAVLLPTMDVASSASIMFLFLFFLVNISVIKIRLNMGDELSYGFIMPLFPWPPILAILIQGILAVWLFHMSLIAWIVAPAWIIGGILIYFIYSKSHAISTPDEVHVIEETVAPVNDQYKIMVAVANPNNALSIIKTTYLISDVKNASVNLLHMVPVPDHVPLSDAEKFMMDGKEAITEAMLYLFMKFPITSTIRYCRNIARGILSAVREKKVDMLIMGWHGKTRSRIFSLGSIVDLMLERAHCDVVILKDCGNKKFENILVPIDGTLNGVFALKIASIIAEKDKAGITVLMVSSNRIRFGGVELPGLYQNHEEINYSRITTKYIESNDVVGTILEQSKNSDLVVLGPSRVPLMYQLARESVSRTVAQRCGKPVVLVRRSQGIKSWIRKIL
ncbi:amino acid permease [Elusimicrobiota bacterium]